MEENDSLAEVGREISNSMIMTFPEVMWVMLWDKEVGG